MYRGLVFFPADQYTLYINTYILFKPDANYLTTNYQYIIHFIAQRNGTSTSDPSFSKQTIVFISR